MDFIDEVKALAAKIPGLLEHIKNEATTRTALVEPFIKVLGYDTSNPAEVLPEFGANLDLPGVNKDKHVDYAIQKDGQVIILIEVKPYGKDPSVGIGQLYEYFNKVEARFAIATNGIIYRFYTDLEKKHLLDKTPFLEIDMLNLDESRAEELKKLTKSAFDKDAMVAAANELKFVGGILEILTEQLDSTDKNFAKYFFQRLCPERNFAGAVQIEFTAFTQRALKQFIREQINNLLNSELGDGTSIVTPRVVKPVPVTPPDEDSDTQGAKQINTTPDELEGFYIVKSILREVVDPNRISYRDVVGHFGILLDNNTHKHICRLYFNNVQNKRLGILDHSGDGKQEEKVLIEDLNDIYKYADRLKATIAYYSK